MSANGSPEPTFSTNDSRSHFLAVLPVHPELPRLGEAHDGAHDGAHVELTETAWSILKFVRTEPRRKVEIAEFLGVPRRNKQVRSGLESLQLIGAIELTIPSKPNSSNQRYRLTEVGVSLLDGSE